MRAQLGEFEKRQDQVIMIEPEDGWLDLHTWRLMNLHEGKTKREDKTIQRWIGQFKNRRDAVRGLPLLADSAGLARASFRTNGPATFIIDRQGTVRFGRRTLGDEDRMTANELLYMLDELKKKHSLISGISRGNGPLGRTAARILKNPSKRSSTDISHLASALAHKDVNFRRGAAAALGWIAPQAKKALPQLIGALKDNDSQVRRLSAEALWLIKPDAKEAVPAIVRATANNRKLYRLIVVARLRRFGAAAFHGFREMLKHPDANLRAQAAKSLWRFKWEEQFYPVSSTRIVAALVPLLHDPDVRVRRAAAEGIFGLRFDWNLQGAIDAIRDLGPDASMKTVQTSIEQTYQALVDRALAIPPLRLASKDHDPQVRKAATRALNLINGAIEAAGGQVTVYLFALNSTNESVRDKAAHIIKGLADKQLSATLPAIGKALTNPNKRHRQHQFAAALLAILLKRLEHKDFWQRRSAANAIGHLGQAAKPAIPALRRAVNDKSDDVRWAATQALKRIEQN